MSSHPAEATRCRRRRLVAVSAVIVACLHQWTLPRAFFPGATAPPQAPEAKSSTGVVVIDRSGEEESIFLKDGAKERGLAVVELWTGSMIATRQSKRSGPAPETGEAMSKWLAELPFQVRGVMAFADFLSLPVAEEIAAKAGLVGTGVEETDRELRWARRDKFRMQEVVRKAGLASARQAMVYSAKEARAFAEHECGGRAVMKPFVGMRGLNVTLLDYNMAGAATEELVNSVFRSRPAQLSDRPLLLQEVLVGEEFACDVVARDGEIAVMAIFEYERRTLNGAAFVMYGCTLVDAPEGSSAEAAAKYTIEAMAALGMRNGLAHIEVKVTPDRGPVLIEANCHRFNGQPCFALSREAYGYSHMDAFLDAVSSDISAEEWRRRYPPLPPSPIKAFGGCAELHVTKAGFYKGGDEGAFQALQELESVSGLEAAAANLHVGEWLNPTVDKATVPVCVWLRAPDPESLERDYQKIWEIEKGMFQVDESSPVTNKKEHQT